MRIKCMSRTGLRISSGQEIVARKQPSRGWHKALRACGITPAGKSTGIHQLRHHVASLLLANGMSIAEVAEVLGDTVQEVSETYAHAMPDFRHRLRATTPHWRRGSPPPARIPVRTSRPDQPLQAV
jgi:integrase